MIPNFRGKKTKDIETASDTIMHNTEFITSIRSNDPLANSITSNLQQHNPSNFDAFIEKKNKEH